MKNENFGSDGPEGMGSDEGGMDEHKDKGMRDFSAKPKKKPGINPMMIMQLLAAAHGGGMGGPPPMAGGAPPMGGPPGMGGGMQ